MSQTGTSRCCMGFKKSRQTKYLRHELFDKVDQIIEYQPLSKEIIEKLLLREHNFYWENTQFIKRGTCSD